MVATKKDPSMSGRKMLLPCPLVDEKDPDEVPPWREHHRGVVDRPARHRRMVLFRWQQRSIAPGTTDRNASHHRHHGAGLSVAQPLQLPSSRALPAKSKVLC